MTSGAKKARVMFIAAFCLVALATIILPYATLGYDPEVRARDTLRDTGFYYYLVWGKAWNDANESFDWMEVHAHLYQLKSDGPRLQASGVNGGEPAQLLIAKARFNIGYSNHGTFKTMSDHYWDYDGQSFGEDHGETDWEYF